MGTLALFDVISTYGLFIAHRNTAYGEACSPYRLPASCTATLRLPHVRPASYLKRCCSIIILASLAILPPTVQCSTVQTGQCGSSAAQYIIQRHGRGQDVHERQ